MRRIIRCVDCDSLISNSVKFKPTKKGLFMRPSDVHVRVLQHIRNKKVVCSCGQTLGKIVQLKENWRCLLNSRKVNLRSVITDSQSQLQLPCSSKEVSSTENSSEPSSSYGKIADSLEMKKKLQKLEFEMNSMKAENLVNFTEMSEMLFMYKFEILRLQEIIWSLHPNVDLSSSFMVNSKDISEALSGIVEMYEEESGFESAASGY